MNPELTPRVSNLKPGDHLCFCSKPDPAGRIQAPIGSIQEALAKGQRSICVAEGTTVAELAKGLTQGGIDVERARAQGRLKLWTRQEWGRAWEELLRNEAAHITTRAARAKIEKMLDGMGDGCVALDAEGRVTHANEGAARLLGKPVAELVGKKFWQEFPAVSRSQLEQACKCALAEQIIVEFDSVFLSGDRWTEVKAFPLSAHELGLCFREITDQKRASEALAAMRRDLKAQAEDLRQLHAVGGGRPPTEELETMLGEVLRAALTVNGAELGLLSLCDPKREGLWTTVSSGFGPEFLQISEYIPPGVGACGFCYQQRQCVIVEDVETDPLFVRYRETAKVGGFRGVHCTPLMLRGGRIIGVLSVYFREPHRPGEQAIRLIDLYARQAATSIENARLLSEITEARDAAERASRAKDNFFAALSQELRAPLNPVLLVASEGAGNPDLSAEVREDFNTIARNVSLEARLIDDLLNLTGIPHGTRAFEMRTLDIHDILQTTLVALRPQLERKRIALTLGLRAPHYTVRGDAVRLQQIFANVLANAVKFTGEKGMISLETRTIATKGMLAVTISDTGIGMTEGELGVVFNAFALGSHPARTGSHRAGSMGLGLAHSRALVELHAGRIRAFSAGRDQGSTFVIELPLAPAEESTGLFSSPSLSAGKPPLIASADAAGRHCRILLVEDHEPTRIALAKLLVRRRYEVTTAGSVAEAVALAEQKEFDLLVADIGLPDADGYDLMTTLRERHGLKGIAVTGYGMEQDVARSKAAGFVAHLTKPVSAQTFERALAAAAAP